MMFTVPAYRIVNYKYPIQEDNPIGIAFGYAFDRALLECNYHGLSVASTLQYFKDEFLRMMNGYSNSITQEQLQQILQQASMMFLAYKETPIYRNSLLRPKTRVVVINNAIGVYMQPDFYDPLNDVFYEVKSYPLRKDEYMFKRLCYQVRLYQLAYPKSKAVAVGFCNGNGSSNGNGNGSNSGYELLELPSLTPREKLSLLQEIIEAVRTKSIDDMQVQEEDIAVVLNRVEAVFYSISIG
jgi:hypothetical protein